MAKDFQQTAWDATLADDCRQLVRLALREDLQHLPDWTTDALVPCPLRGSATVVARQPGVLAGLPAAALALDEMAAAVRWEPCRRDGDRIEQGAPVARMSGPVRAILTAERLVLNLLSRLSGVASLTCRYVDAVADRPVGIYDTRKTTPGWRRLEKYAVRCGGGRNHRTGLFDAVLIKDNHLAVPAAANHSARWTPAAAVRRAREFLRDGRSQRPLADLLIEIEVDTLEQLEDALAAAPDIVLLDNMPPDLLRAAVALRDRLAPQVELEASGGIDLETVALVAATGVTRISIGALTHSAAWLDLGLELSPFDG